MIDRIVLQPVLLRDPSSQLYIHMKLISKKFDEEEDQNSFSANITVLHNPLFAVHIVLFAYRLFG